MFKSSEKKVSLTKRAVDNVQRRLTGKLEETKRIEIDYITEQFIKHFGNTVPEILKLGEHYNERKPLGKETFKLEYWTAQLKGYFYQLCERMINTMCSYEVSKMKAILNDGYTDDPVHLLFYVIKLWLVELSNTHFDQQDLETACKWQQLIKSLISSGIFKPSREDNRMMVLFTLEKMLRLDVIPTLSQNIANKSAFDHLKSTQAHLTMFFNHAFKYLFYVGRDSQYEANFDSNKLLAIVGEKLPGENNFLTSHQSQAWSSLKDTIAIKLLHDLIKEDLPLLTETTNNSVSNPVSGENKALTNVFFHENPNHMAVYLKLPLDLSVQKFAAHIDLQAYLNSHLFLKEILHFIKLFNSAQYCAEMGGNLLVYGALGDQLITDISDCINCLTIIFQYCEKIESDAWKAYEDKLFSAKDPLLDYVSDQWVENYSQSAISYFGQLKIEFDLTCSALSQLAAASTKKTTKELIQETQMAINTYKDQHEKHHQHRMHLLSHHTLLNYQLRPKALAPKQPVTLNQLEIKTLYKDGVKLYKDQKTIEQGKEYAKAMHLRIKDESRPSIDDYYYASRFFSKFLKGQEKARQLLTTIVNKEQNHIKANYRLAQSFYYDKKPNEAKHYCDIAIRSAQQNGLHTFINKKLMPLLEAIMASNSQVQQIGGSNAL